MRTSITIKWDSEKWQYIAIGLNKSDTVILNDLLSSAKSNDSAFIKARAYEQSIANRKRCNADLVAFSHSL